MKKITLFIVMLSASMFAMAQSVNVHQGENSVGFNVAEVDSITFSTKDAEHLYDPTITSGSKISVDGHWLSLGTSISWYNNNVSSAFTKGYQTRVLE